MDGEKILSLTLGMAVVTALPRLLPMWFLSERKLSPVLLSCLKYVPVAVIAAMLAPQLLIHEKRVDFTFSNLYFWASLPTFLIAWRSKNLFLTVISGIGCLALIRAFLS